MTLKNWILYDVFFKNGPSRSLGKTYKGWPLQNVFQFLRPGYFKIGFSSFKNKKMHIQCITLGLTLLSLLSAY